MTVDQDTSRASQAVSGYAASQPTRFIARQPVFDARRNVVGYELLFRSGWENYFRGGADDATLQTLDNCVTMGLESLAGSGLAFVNCTREALVSRLVTVLPPSRTVLEILEDVEPDEEMLEACRELRSKGYAIALDDFMPRPEMKPLIRIANYVKVDFRLADTATRRLIHDMVRGTGAALLAEKIEDQAEFSRAMAEGYEYFQGYFFCRPIIVANREIPPNWTNYVSLLAELSKSPMNVSEVIRIVQAETSICYRLLRLANSAVMGVRNEVTSVRAAMVLVGEDRFRTLVSLAVSSALARNQPPALISLSLERARFCELMAPLTDQSPTEQYMLGLLSLLDAMLQRPMEALAGPLPLRRAVKEALLGVANPVATSLNLIRSFETGEWGRCAAAAEKLGVSEEHLSNIYMESVQWASTAFASSR